MNDGLKDKHRRAIIDTLAANPRVGRVVLFGSRATGGFTATSDVDLVLFGDELTLTDQARLAAAVEALSMPQRVDLLRHKAIENQKLLEEIRKHGVTWFDRDTARKTPASSTEPVQEPAARANIGETSGAQPPSTKGSPVGTASDAYESQVQGEFQRLLQSAEKKNRLYFLMTVCCNWPAIRWTSHFVGHVNEITRRLILNRPVDGSARTIPPHEILFALQINLEAKAVYAVMRNLVFVAAGKHARPDPWKQQRGEYRTDKNGQVTISTRRILANLVDDFRDAGFALLADELEATHLTNIGHVRNAIAHSTFCCPGPETNHKWVFASYVESTPGFIAIEPREYTKAEFQQICWRFFAFRLAFAGAIDECRATLGQRCFTFQAENQMKPGELLDCGFERGSVSVKFKGTPLW